MAVLEMGCGHGHYTILASIASYENGKVIAADMDNKVRRVYEKIKAGKPISACLPKI